MTVHEAPVPDDQLIRDDPLELLGEAEDDVLTAVPADATGDERITQWLTIDRDVLCDLLEWQ
ncbi:hypothetical protein ACFQGT_06735 [Natrialbaceae archaeon GCM10025810]|uniref:DUF7511 domain-containing protein n=1 Tax=Halovalidus salilacus TaxID=3075124 RepID=UPI0036071495